MGIIDSVLLLFLLIGGSHAFVFSCEEVKYKLINSNLQEPTQFVCLVLDHNYPVESLKKVYAQVDKVSTSFYDLASAQCIERPSNGAWRIVGDSPVNLDCNIEFSLIFTSTKPSITGLPQNDFEYKLTTVLNGSHPEQITAAPGTGIVLHKIKCSGNGLITVFTGAGSGVSEYRYPMTSSECVYLPEWIVSFENVISIVVEDGVQLQVDHTLLAYMNEIDVSASTDVVVMSSGKSDNLQNKEGISNVVTFVTGVPLVADAICVPCAFDARYDGQVRLTFNDDQSTNTSTEIFHDEHQYFANVERYLQVAYETKTIAPQNIWENDDTFLMQISFTGAVQPSTPSAPTTGDAGEYCSCPLDKKFGMAEGWDPSQIWIDVVIILDTSEAMGQQALIDAITLIYSLFGTDDDDVLTTNTRANFYTRVGLIAMSNKPEVLFNLNMTKADSVEGKTQITKGLTEIDVAAAFNAAQQMLLDGRKNDPDRQNSRPVIYYMANSDPPTITQPMSQFKEEEGVIIVNNFIEKGLPRPGLEKLASPGYYFSDIQYNYMATIQLFCKANCYCLKDKESYAGTNPDIAVKASGGCFHAVPVGAQFSNAKSNCAHGSGLIASIHDQNKGQFVNGIMKKAAPGSDYYWIGYSKTDAGWKWEDQSPNPYVHWDVGEPATSSVAKCTYVDSTTSGLYWGAGNCNVGFPFPCEYAPCAVGNKNCTLPV